MLNVRFHETGVHHKWVHNFIATHLFCEHGRNRQANPVHEIFAKSQEIYNADINMVKKIYIYTNIIL